MGIKNKVQILLFPVTLAAGIITGIAIERTKKKAAGILAVDAAPLALPVRRVRMALRKANDKLYGRSRGRLRAVRLENDRTFRDAPECVPGRLDVILRAGVIRRTRYHRNLCRRMPRRNALYLCGYFKHLRSVRSVRAECEDDIAPFHRFRACLESLELLLGREQIDGIV